MPAPSNSTSTSWEVIYRWLLFVYPEDFRVEYGREMMMVFRDQLPRKRGFLAASAFWTRILFDVAASAPGEHMDTLWKDVQYAFRMMRRQPGFTLLALMALALGIGATSAIFSVVNGTLLRPLPYPESQRLLWLSGTNLPAGIKAESASGPDFLDWQSQNRSFADLTCFSGWQPVLTGQGAPERIPGALVSSGFFRLLGVPALIGRTFETQDDQPGRNQVVLSYGIWRRLFGGVTQVLGKPITLNGNSYTVIGVMPSTFLFPGTSPSEIWTVYDSALLAKRGRRADHLGVIGRLKNGVELSQAQADLDALAAALEARYPDTNTNWRISAMPLLERSTGTIKPALLVLLGAVGVLLLMACTNVAGLMLVRGMARQKEIALRTALGAARRRVLRQLLTESVLLAAMGGALGLALAWLGVKGLVNITPADVPRIHNVDIDGVVLAFTSIISVVTGVFFGFAPAFQLSRPDVANALKEVGRGATPGRRSVRVRNILTVSELALAVVLLTGAGLLVRSYIRLLSVNPGFRPEHLLTFRLSLPASKYPDDVRIAGFYDRMLERIHAAPGITDAGIASDPPFLGENYWAFQVQGRPQLPPGTNQDALTNIVSAEYFRVMDVPLVRGRRFAESDSRHAPPVVIISESMARRYWAHEDPIGARIAFDGTDNHPNWREIVGVVGDTRAVSLAAPPYPQFYVPYSQIPQRSMTILVRTAGDPARVLPDIRTLLFSIDREQPLHAVMTMESILSDSIAQQRLSMLLLAFFAILALILAGIGVYGVMSHSVGQRTQEMGVRMALGARSLDVLKMILAEGMTLAAIGILIGSFAAIGLARLMSGMLFGIEAYDPATFIAIVLLLTAVAFLACFVPARRATQVDAVVALRCE